MRHFTCLARHYRCCLNVTIRREGARGTVLAIAMTASTIFPAGSQSLQPPSEEYYLQSMSEDASHSFGLINSKNAAGADTGFVQLNGLRNPSNPSTIGGPQSQWWQDIFPLSGETDTVKLKNHATGQCIGWNAAGNPVASMLPCSDGEALWERASQGDSGIVYRKGIAPGGLFVTPLWYCLANDPSFPGLVTVEACTLADGASYPDYMVWSRTTAPIGVVSIGLTPAPPPVPPTQPTACRLSGAAVCGQVGFSCNPLSASDTIVVSSGTIGVKVTGVQASIGLITATYLNSGQASVSVCATKPGLYSCSPPIPVSFGPRTCTAPPPPPEQLCPTGQEICKGVCAPFGTCIKEQ